MARAYLQGQGQKRESEPEPEPAELARPDGPHRYRYPQKTGHHHHVPPADDVLGSPTSGCPVGAAPRREVAGAAEEAGGAATSAVGADEDDPGVRPLVISSRARSSRTCRKEGKGLWRVVIGAVETP